MPTHREIVLVTSTNRSAIEWLITHTYIPGAPLCTNCTDKRMVIEEKNRNIRWRCTRFNERISIFHSTIFFNSNLELVKIIDLVYFWCLNLTQNYTMNEIDSNSRLTITCWYRLLSTQCWHIMRRIQRSKIGGIGRIVEVDESKFSKRKFNVGRLVRSPWVIGGVDINSGELFFREVLFRNQSYDRTCAARMY